MIRRLIVAAAFLSFAFVAGCKHKCGHHLFHRDAKPCCPPGAGPGPGSSVLLPPAGVPTTPAPGPRRSAGGADGSTQLPARAACARGSLARSRSRRWFVAEFAPRVSWRSRQSQRRSADRAARQRCAERALGYTRVKEGLASGRKPSLDGFDALKQAGFRTVLYLHAAGADWSAAEGDRDQARAAFVAIETTPEKLAERH